MKKKEIKVGDRLAVVFEILSEDITLFSDYSKEFIYNGRMGKLKCNKAVFISEMNVCETLDEFEVLKEMYLDFYDDGK